MFDVSTGLWNFGPSALSTKAVESDPYGEKMIADFRERPSIFDDNMVSFTPCIDSETCQCEICFIYI